MSEAKNGNGGLPGPVTADGGGFGGGVGQDLSAFVKTSLVDLVTRQIRNGIFTGRFLAGQKLIVRELSEAMGVSHTPIKDALNRLISEGLVEAFPNRSMRVRHFTNNDLIENLGVRLMCEVFFADEIVRGAERDSALIGDLEGCLDAMRVAITGSEAINYEVWVDTETLFHRRYMAACDNTRLISVYSGLDANRYAFFAFLHRQRTPLHRKSLESNLVEHREIVDALAAHDVTRFRRAVIAHVTRACDDYAVDADAVGRIAQIKRLVAPYLSETTRN